MPVPMRRDRAAIRDRSVDETVQALVHRVFDWWMSDMDTEPDAFEILRGEFYREIGVEPPKSDGHVIDIERMRLRVLKRHPYMVRPE